jgi:ABC-type phosphate transport system substrate-binding protein
VNYRFTLRAAVLVIVCSTWAYARDIALVANKENGLKSVSEAELIKIAKGTFTQWPNGQPITLVLRIPASPAMKLVLDKVYELPPSAVNDLIYTANHGRLERPAFIIVNSDEAVLKKVMAQPGTIGLVDIYSITGSVRVLRVGGKLPLERGYLLHEN